MDQKRYDILLAHPDTSRRDYFEEQATSNDFARVVSVASARDALAVLNRTPVDAFFCPIELGDMDVWRLARMIRSGTYGSLSLPIIALCDENQTPLVEAIAKEHDIHLVTFTDNIYVLGERVTKIIDGRPKHSALIIEDDHIAAAAAQQAIEKAYNVETQHNGLDGLQAWMERRHDIVLLDVMLPGLSGPKVLQKILAENTEQPVIVLTAYSTMERHEELMFAGADEFLPKPFDITQLAGLCDRILHNKRLVTTLHDSQLSEAEKVRMYHGARAATYKLSQGRAGEASLHLQSALNGISNAMSDDEWAQLLSKPNDHLSDIRRP